mgnify:CR=1 FL=1
MSLIKTLAGLGLGMIVVAWGQIAAAETLLECVDKATKSLASKSTEGECKSSPTGISGRPSCSRDLCINAPSDGQVVNSTVSVVARYGATAEYGAQRLLPTGQAVKTSVCRKLNSRSGATFGETANIKIRMNAEIQKVPTTAEIILATQSCIAKLG